MLYFKKCVIKIFVAFRWVLCFHGMLNELFDFCCFEGKLMEISPEDFLRFFSPQPLIELTLKICPKKERTVHIRTGQSRKAHEKHYGSSLDFVFNIQNAFGPEPFPPLMQHTFTLQHSNKKLDHSLI